MVLVVQCKSGFCTLLHIAVGSLADPKTFLLQAGVSAVHKASGSRVWTAWGC